MISGVRGDTRGYLVQIYIRGICYKVISGYAEIFEVQGNIPYEDISGVREYEGMNIRGIRGSVVREEYPLDYNGTNKLTFK